jgi:hypothetical protein
MDKPVVALVTDSISPALSVSDQTLEAPLRERGVEVAAVPWEAPEVDWRGFDLVVLRSCWNYHRHLAAFRSWIDRLEAEAVRLWNPAPVVRWNLDKGYLRDLADAGASVVPTVCLDSGQSASLAAILQQQGWERAVVKPRVSASAHGIWQTDQASAAQSQPPLEALLAAGGALVQPLMPQIATGEWSFVFFAGAFSHAVFKTPAADNIFVQKRLGGSSVLRAAPATLVEQAAALLQIATARLLPAGEQLLYARVDGLDVDGRLALMEMEITEPGLFLDLAAPAGAARFAAAMVGRLERIAD